MTATRHKAFSHAVHARRHGQDWVMYSAHTSAKKAAKAAALWLDRGFTARVVAL